MEYKTITLIAANEVAPTINDHVNNGWEFVSITTFGCPHYNFLILFSRMKPFNPNRGNL
jgi:hypothetical protein